MANRKSQKARIGFESLERRDTPGSLVGGEVAALAAHTAVHAAATKTKTLVFRGAGRETVTKTTPLAKGALQVVGTMTGAATNYGIFTGTNVTVFTAGLRTFRSAAVLTAKDGSKLVLSIIGVKGSGNNATGTFKITGGNGRFAHATGSGAVTGVLSLATKTLVFNFNGTVRKPA